jgi:hypothetical protein
LPVILARILQIDPADQNEDDKAVEQVLLKTLLEFIRHSQQFQQDLQAQVPPGTVVPFTLILVSNLRQCVKSVMVSRMEKSQLRQALLSSRTRAEIMHVIVQLGDSLTELTKDNPISVEWVQIRDTFMAMLDQ